jgi:hypothetical protein
MARVLGDSEIREICDLLIPIIRKEGPFKAGPLKFAWAVMDQSSDNAKEVWKLLLNVDYAEELIE